MLRVCATVCRLRTGSVLTHAPEGKALSAARTPRAIQRLLMRRIPSQSENGRLCMPSPTLPGMWLLSCPSSARACPVRHQRGPRHKAGALGGDSRGERYGPTRSGQQHSKRSGARHHCVANMIPSLMRDKPVDKSDIVVALRHHSAWSDQRGSMGKFTWMCLGRQALLGGSNPRRTRTSGELATGGSRFTSPVAPIHRRKKAPTRQAETLALGSIVVRDLLRCAHTGLKSGTNFHYWLELLMQPTTHNVPQRMICGKSGVGVKKNATRPRSRRKTVKSKSPSRPLAQTHFYQLLTPSSHGLSFDDTEIRPVTHASWIAE